MKRFRPSALSETLPAAEMCVFHAIADGYFRASRTAFQTDRGRRFKPIVDAVSA
jgi:hypothetical protein